MRGRFRNASTIFDPQHEYAAAFHNPFGFVDGKVGQGNLMLSRLDMGVMEDTNQARRKQASQETVGNYGSK